MGLRFSKMLKTIEQMFMFVKIFLPHLASVQGL